MIIIGEKLNSSRKAVREAIAARDTEAISSLAKAQEQAGAQWLDINAAMLPDEAESIVWMGECCRSVSELPLCIDSPDFRVTETALQRLGGKCMINSITLEKERFDNMLRLARQFGCPIVALCMDDGGMPETVGDRVRIAGTLFDRLTAAGVPADDIYIDPMLSPVGAVETAGADALETIRKISSLGAHCVCGLSNISYGLPARPWINSAFMVAAMISGLDAAIADPLDKRLMRLVLATEAMLGTDEYCENYIDAYRDGFFDD